MAEQRWKAITDIVISGKAIKAGATFSAPAESLGEAVARGLVQPAPKGEGKRSSSS